MRISDWSSDVCSSDLISIGANALAFGQAAGASHHFLGKRKALAGGGWILGQAKQGGRLQAQRLAGPGGKPAADDQRNPPAGPRFIEQHLRLELEFGNDLAILVTRKASCRERVCQN